MVVRGPNIFTITEVQGSYGRLKSGAGWLNLCYAEWLCSESTHTQNKGQMHNSTCPFLYPRRKPLRGVLRVQNKVTPPESF